MIGDIDVENNRCLVDFSLFIFPLLIFLLQIHFKENPQENCHRNNSHQPQGIGTGVSDGDIFTRIPHVCQCFFSSAKTRRTSDGAVMNTQNLRQ